MKLAGYLVYVIVRWFLLVIGELWWRVDVTGRANIPKEGPFLLCPVHRSNVDGPLAATLTSRHMKYLAKGEMFRPAAFGRLIDSMGAIPVNRGAPDRVSLKTCVDVLEGGDPLVLFPEGGRRSGPIITEVQEGAAYLALRTGVPVVPVGIAGTEGVNPRGTPFLLPVKVRVAIGEPLVFAKPEGSRVPRSAIRDSTELLKDRLQELFDQAARKDEA